VMAVMASRWVGLGWLVALVVLSEHGDAAIPLKAEGQAGFWNQLVVGGSQAYPDRIGGLTIKSNAPKASLVDRESPQSYGSRWDIIMLGKRLAFVRGGGEKPRETLTVDSNGHATINGNVKIDGALRAREVVLEGALGQKAQTFVLGQEKTAKFRVGNDAKFGYIQSDYGNLAINPNSAKNLTTAGVVGFSSDVPKTHLDVHAEAWLDKHLKLGQKGDTEVSSTAIKFGRGGGWEPSGKTDLGTVGKRPVHFDGGAVFGDRLGFGIEGNTKFRAQVHDGHFVVSNDVERSLRGVATFVTPSASFIKAYDYTNKKAQNLRITGSKILINPGHGTNSKTCIGCKNPEYHLQTKGNAYVDGNVLVNKNLHVAGNMHIDKVITPKVFVHSRAETPDYGRGLMIGNDLKNEYGTVTNMRLGYNKGYGWIQSHQAVPIAINPIGGGTCISCSELSREDVEVEVNGDALIDGELYVATLPTTGRATTDEDYLNLLQESETMTPEQEKASLEQELGSEHMDLVSTWASTTKIIKSNRKLLLARRKEIEANDEIIRRLESKIFK